MIEPAFTIYARDPAEIAAWQAMPGFRDIPPTALPICLGGLDPHATRALWITRQNATCRVVALAQMVLPATEAEKWAYFDIVVQPAFRRRGLGTRLLRPIADLVAATRRNLLIAQSLSTMPEGAAFLAQIGAKPDVATGCGACEAAADAAEIGTSQPGHCRWRIPLSQLRDHLDRAGVAL